MKNKDLVITLRDGTIIIWSEDEYADYSYSTDVFVVKNDIGEWIGIYNMKMVVSIEVGYSGNEGLVDEDY